ncbi:hypothetical protein ABKN59_007802 [Abortiporus biennis]
MRSMSLVMIMGHVFAMSLLQLQLSSSAWASKSLMKERCMQVCTIFNSSCSPIFVIFVRITALVSTKYYRCVTRLRGPTTTLVLKIEDPHPQPIARVQQCLHHLELSP